MPAFKTFLDETLEAWEDVRSGIIQEAENIPEDKYDFRPVAEVRTVKELIVHILKVAMMMTGELTRADTNFSRAPWPDLLKLYSARVLHAKTKAQLISLLKSQIIEAEKKFQEAGELHLLQFIKRFDGQIGTRLAWLQHGIAQEMYHRGQLTLYERLMGIEPALTKKIKSVTK